VEKNNNRLACERYFWSSRRIPCERIFCAVVCTSNNGDNVKSFLPNSDARWKLREIVDDNEIIDQIRQGKFPARSESQSQELYETKEM